MANVKHSTAPWSVHSTGSHLGIKSADGKFVIRKTVSSLSLDAFHQLLADFEHIVQCVNTCEKRNVTGKEPGE